jgi:hypothetical protein
MRLEKMLVNLTQVTEAAKDIIGNIGEKLQDLGK